jgi:hypothetical protein
MGKSNDSLSCGIKSGYFSHVFSSNTGKILTACCDWRNFQSTIKESSMNWDRIEGNWKQFKGIAARDDCNNSRFTGI